MTAASTRFLGFVGEGVAGACHDRRVGYSPAADTLGLLSLPAVGSRCLARLFPAGTRGGLMVGDRLEATFAPWSEEPE